MRIARVSRAAIMAASILIVGAAAGAQVKFGTPVNMGPNINSPANEGSPSVTADGLEMYFTSNRPGGYGANDIWVSTRQSKKQPWGPAVNLGPVVNSAAGEVAASVSADGLELIFSDYGAQRPGGVGKTDLWVSKRESRTSPWGAPENLGTPVNSSEDEITPTMSTDGLELYIDTYRPGELGASDLWVARRETKSSPWGAPVWLGPTINSVGVEHCPTLSADDLVMFFDMTPPNQKTEIGDLMMTRRASIDDPWGAPVNLGHEQSTHWASCISHDGKTLYYASSASGGLGGGDIWEIPIEIER